MDRITVKHVRSVFELYAKEVPAPAGQRWALEEASPGDGATRFTLYATDETHCWAEPLGRMCWVGAREAWEGLRSMHRVAHWMNEQRAKEV